MQKYAENMSKITEGEIQFKRNELNNLSPASENVN